MSCHLLVYYCKLLANILQFSCKHFAIFLPKFLAIFLRKFIAQTSDKFLSIFLQFPVIFLQFLANFLQISSNFLSNFSKLLTGFLSTSCKFILNFLLSLLMNGFLIEFEILLFLMSFAGNPYWRSKAQYSWPPSTH